nr:MAG TPA: hypothetical protein [Caudoviricetes sp.]
MDQINSYVTIHYAVSLYNHGTIKFDDSLKGVVHSQCFDSFVTFVTIL